MSNKRKSQISSSQPRGYQIRIQGHLGLPWTEWFDGLTITLQENGDTCLTGPMIDQAALHGLLKKVRDLGMLLVSVNCVEYSQTDASNEVQFNETIEIDQKRSKQ